MRSQLINMNVFCPDVCSGLKTLKGFWKITFAIWINYNKEHINTMKRQEGRNIDRLLSVGNMCEWDNIIEKMSCLFALSGQGERKYVYVRVDLWWNLICLIFYNFRQLFFNTVGRGVLWHGWISAHTHKQRTHIRLNAFLISCFLSKTDRHAG